MRMWNVDPRLMCTQHLLGEHVEMHMFVGCIRKDHNLDGYVNGGMVHIKSIPDRHSALVDEMIRRGFEHRSPLPPFAIDDSPSSVDPVANLAELRRRCPECAEKGDCHESRTASR